METSADVSRSLPGIASAARNRHGRPMILLGILFFMLVVIAGAVNSAKRRDPPPPALPDERSASELAADDPVEALLRYGTTDDAARLADQGVDLGGLGYRSHDG